MKKRKKVTIHGEVIKGFSDIGKEMGRQIFGDIFGGGKKKKRRGKNIYITNNYYRRDK